MADQAEASGEAVAAEAARRAGITLARLDTAVEVQRASELLAEVWRTTPDHSPMPANLIRALEHSGSYAFGAYNDRGELVGASVGLLAGHPGDVHLHSHITGVALTARSRGFGFAIKLHQRAWCLMRGIGTVTWTVDPLVRRNAVVNLVKIGARPIAYLEDFYGVMPDGINRDDATDRLLVEWQLRAGAEQCTTPQVAMLSIDDAGRPVSGTVGPDVCVSVAVPADVEAMRENEPLLAREWRVAVRDALGGSLQRGRKVIGFDRDLGYVLGAEGSHSANHAGVA